MTKTAEIAALDTFIAKLGNQSYVGPWLADNRDEIVRDITSDFAPSVMLPNAARREAQDILAAARAEAALIREQAVVAADEMRTRTQKACDEQRETVARIIQRAAADSVRTLTGRSL